jgi:hypothetical protein
MDVVILLVFISLGLVAASLLFFVHRLREGDFDHGDRLSLAPLDDGPPPPATTDPSPPATADPPLSNHDGAAAKAPAEAENSQIDTSNTRLEGGSTHDCR